MSWLRSRAFRFSSWLLVALAAAAWILCVAGGLPVPTPLEVVATPIGSWSLFTTGLKAEDHGLAPADDRFTPAPESKPVTLAATAAGESEADRAREGRPQPEPTSDASTARASSGETLPQEPALATPQPVVFFGAHNGEVESQGRREQSEDGRQPVTESAVQRLVAIVAAGQRLIDGTIRPPTIGAAYSMQTVEEFIRQGWFYVLALVGDAESFPPRVYVLRPDAVDPLRSGDFTLPDSTFVASHISQIALPLAVPELYRLFRLQVGGFANTSIQVRARADVAHYIVGKQFGAMRELGFTAEQMEQGPLFTDGVLVVGRGRPVYRILQVQVGADVRPWVDPEGATP